MQRARGSLVIDFAADHRPVIRATAPLRALTPMASAGERAPVVMVNVAGGIAGGDELSLSVTAHQGARALVLSQAAERVYRPAVSDAPSALSTGLTVQDCAVLEFMPLPTILFDQANLRRRVSITLSGQARLIYGDILVLGRHAHGEWFARGRLDDQLTVEVGEQVAWVDRMVLDSNGPMLDAALGWAGHRVMAVLILAGPGSAALAEPLRALPIPPSVRAAIGHREPVTVVRMLAPTLVDVVEYYKRCWAQARHQWAGLPLTLPRIWQI